MSSRIKEDVKKLFEFWCEVTRSERTASANPKTAGVIVESFPESFRDDQITTKIPDFAYPCDFEIDSVQTYSFVLTSDDSKWRFGFCRHDPKTQRAMILITYLPWHDTFLRLLGVLGELRRTTNGEFESFLSEAYNKGVPEPGASLKICYHLGQNHFIFQRPSQFQLPSIPENHNLNLYYNFVDPKNMIAVFAAMLAERRLIFTSRRLDKLSSCIQAANAFLYPMVWQHIFIPVLPMKMKDILSAPMPYLIGVPEAVLQTMTPEELGEVVILYCDSKIFQSPFDDVRQMPPELVLKMKKQLSNSHEHIGDRVSKIFLGILVQLIGGYRDAVRFSQGQKITWDRDVFVDTRPPHLRPFLAKMMELQIFQQFIDERLDMLNTGLGISDEFEMETVRYSERKRGNNYKEFLRNVKDKTNPAVKSAVKSVKEGSRGVKTAYKDLKSKLRDITPPKSHFHMHISHSSQSDTFTTGISGHRSAPNSPVFGKRSPANHEFNHTGSGGVGHSGSSSSSGARKQKHSNNSTAIAMSSSTSLALQTSNSQTFNGFINYTNHNPINNNNNINSSNNKNNNLTASSNYINKSPSKSPTVSPSSSLCSSDMNISQELQNHPLFKSPTVDRSLKPSNSLEPPTGHRPARFGAPLTASNQKLQLNDVPIGNLCIIDDDENDDADNVTLEGDDFDDDTKSFHTAFGHDSLFDSPPDMPSPPIPPKRTNGSATNLNKSSTVSVKANGQLPASMSASYAFENNFVANQSSNVVSPEKKSAMENRPAPIPAPRQKHKIESQEPLPEMETKDLISLDEGNSSFELEDFDPLNQNAKPLPSLVAGRHNKSVTLPTVSIAADSSTSIPSSGSLSARNSGTVHNPIYPYFTPQHRQATPASIQQSSATRDDDFELLRKYGLDQFSLTNGNATKTKTAKKSNWTTFD